MMDSMRQLHPFRDLTTDVFRRRSAA